MEIISVFSDKFLDLISQGVERIQLSSIEKEGSPSNAEVWTPASGNRTSCSYCRIEFTEQRSQREHYKLDWHRYNLKRALASTEPITEEVFFDKNENDDLSSISGSDSEDEGTVNSYASSQGKLFLNVKNEKVLAIYKCLLFEKEDQLDDDNLFRDVSHKVWAVLMVGGGHFAGAVFNGNEIVAHKTFHSYTVRAAQGGSQSSKDSGGSHPKSAGASLRRYNEQSFVQHVRTTIKRWEDVLEDSSFIFYRAAGPFSRNTLFGGSNPVISRDDRRLRLIPFSTKRPTFAEVKRVHSVLSNVELYDSHVQATRKYAAKQSSELAGRRSKKQTPHLNRAKSREIRERLVSSTNLNSNSWEDLQTFSRIILSKDTLDVSKELMILFDFTNMRDNEIGHKKIKLKELKFKRRARKKELLDIVMKGDIDQLKVKVNNNKNNVNSFINQVLDEHLNTSLHIASLYSHREIVKYLLENEADPCLKNKREQTAYTSTQCFHIRETFKQFAAENPYKYNYNKAQIPVDLISIEEQQQVVRQLGLNEEKEINKRRNIDRNRKKIEEKNKGAKIAKFKREKAEAKQKLKLLEIT